METWFSPRFFISYGVKTWKLGVAEKKLQVFENLSDVLFTFRKAWYKIDAAVRIGHWLVDYQSNKKLGINSDSRFSLFWSRIL